MTSQPVKVLLTTDAVGGVWQYSLDLARSLSEEGVATVLAVLGPPPARAQAKAAGEVRGLTLVDTGLPLDWVAPSLGALRSAGEAIARLAERHGASLVQLHAPALAAEASFPVPVIAVTHSCIVTWWSAVKGTPLEESFRWRAEATGEGLRRADLVVAPSAAFGEATRAAYDLSVRPITVHNGRRALRLPRVAPHDFVFTAGRLWDKAKNVATLERAAAALSIPFYGAGPVAGPTGDSIQLDHMEALGSLREKELGRWLAARPVFVSAAVYEPFGLAVLEAATAGCPLVLSDIPTFRELWDGTASFVPAMDEAGFARAITEIVTDKSLHARQGAAAKARAGLYTPEATASRMLGLYRDLAKASAGAKAMAAA